ncbi:hypothetical protein GQ602_000930 [Ophiocordyceps camponoti-floridani]|uniref:Uncharacterized protein n=1 Tax=Ophiocordyceps camponoti-floridani TaxID=2030778 RepID=A0A8H4VGL7_9HYPO|nr:hypothetical protein GQ602_000930 [Ophiocordyceps camponoti-floridani]
MLEFTGDGRMEVTLDSVSISGAAMPRTTQSGHEKTCNLSSYPLWIRVKNFEAAFHSLTWEACQRHCQREISASWREVA